MPRLIDANALRWDLEERYNKIDRGRTYTGQTLHITEGARLDEIEKAIAAVENAPVIDAEPVRHGRWEWYEEPYDSRNPDGDYGWRCSCCKQDLANELSLGIPQMHYAYDILDDPDNPPTLNRCLFCGAKMDGGTKDG